MNSGGGAPQALDREAQPRKEHAVIRSRLPAAAAAAALGAALALTGTAAAAKRPAVTPPAGIAKAGQIVYCSDITYPPEEFYRGSTPVGSDVDIGTAVARRLGVKARFDNTGFDGIIAALLAKRCDAIISGMNDTAQRRRSVSFVDYLAVGQSLMVKRGNPEHIRTLADLAGRTVSVEVGTTNKQFLDSESAKLQAQGKKAISIETFAKDTDAAAALKTGKVDAYFGDSPVVAYYISRDRAFAFGGQPINPLPVGIAVRKSDAQLRTAIQKAVTKLYRNGTMRRILAKWHMSAFALNQR
jgi:polar amino acid transport system substrate-binding protein